MEQVGFSTLARLIVLCICQVIDTHNVLKTPPQYLLSGRGQSALVGGAIHRLLLPQHVLWLIRKVASKLHVTITLHLITIPLV